MEKGGPRPPRREGGGPPVQAGRGLRRAGRTAREHDTRGRSRTAYRAVAFSIAARPWVNLVVLISMPKPRVEPRMRTTPSSTHAAGGSRLGPGVRRAPPALEAEQPGRPTYGP